MRSIIAIVQKDVARFFSQMTAVMSLVIFYLILGLLLWYLPNFGILEGYYAGLDQFFSYTPVLLVFLIPALNMDAISGEMAGGTLDLLLIRPISTLQIMSAKFLSGLIIVIIGLLPTILYVVTVYYLANPVGNIDLGAIIGSYIGLLLIVVVFTAISLFASAMVVVPVTALMLAIGLCAVFYWAFFLVSSLPLFYGVWDYWIQYLGLDFHYEEMGKGLISLSSIVYIFSLTYLFLQMTWWRIRNIRYQ